MAERYDERRQDAEEARRMDAYVRRARRREPVLLDQACGTCAFRPGTDANTSATNLAVIESCTMRGDTFYCHAGSIRVRGGFVVMPKGKPRRICAGWAAAFMDFPKTEVVES